MSELLQNIADFLNRERAPQSNDKTADTTSMAAAVLLVELARQDFDYGAEERTIIARLVRDRFGLAPREAAALVAHAEDTERTATDDFRYRQIIRKNFSHDERLNIMQMLWQVALADGVLMPLEKDLIHRIGVSIGLDEAQVDNAMPQGQ